MSSPRDHTQWGHLLTRALPILLMLLLVFTLGLSFTLPEGSYSLAADRSQFRALQGLVLALLAATTVTIVAVLPRIVRSAVLRYGHHAVPAPKGSAVASEGTHEALQQAGWRATFAAPGALRFSRHRWSYWSAVMLHVGLALVLGAAFVVFATESRGTLIVHEGERFEASAVLGAPVQGILAGDPILPGDLVGGAVNAEYWPEGGTRQLTAEHIDGDSGETVVVAVNRITRWRGIRLFPSQTWGRTFLVQVVGAGASDSTYAIDVPAGAGIGEAGYRDIEIPDVPYTVRLKSVEQRSGTGGTPVLTLRLESNGEVVAQEVLSVATTVTVGPYAMQLMDADRTWQELYVVRQNGVTPLMIGIALVAIGSTTLYLFPAADVWLLKDGDVSRLVVRTGRLARQRVEDEVSRHLEESDS